MKVKSIAFYNSCDENRTRAEIAVPGLGDVAIENCLPQETIDMIKQQVIEALRVKLKLPVEGEPPVRKTEHGREQG